MRMLLYIIFFIALSANAAIHKESAICEETKEICLYWWPELPGVKGWEQDQQNSRYYNANAQAPIGFNFSNAESVIYAKAVFKPEQPESKTLEEFISNDRKALLSENSALIVKKLKSIPNSNGVKLVTYSFAPKQEGNWEIVSYCEEIDKDGNQYYINFVLSSRSEAAFKKSFEDYTKFVNKYKP